MNLAFRGEFKKLKECVALARLDGHWIKLSDGVRTFRTPQGDYLNWNASTRNIWFEGKDRWYLKSRVLEVARGRIFDLGDLPNKEALKRLSRQVELAEGEIEERFSQIDGELEQLKSMIGRLLDHAGIHDWGEDDGS